MFDGGAEHDDSRTWHSAMEAMAGMADCHAHVLERIAGTTAACAICGISMKLGLDHAAPQAKGAASQSVHFRCIEGCDYELCYSCWTHHRQRDPRRETLKAHLARGERVRVLGLRVLTQRNGHHGTLLEWNDRLGAWRIQYEGGATGHVCEANLEGSLDNVAVNDGRATEVLRTEYEEMCEIKDPT